jgi:hypothetical protein
MINTMSATKSTRHKVHVRRELSDLIPSFLENRYNDIRVGMAFIKRGDLKALRLMGHNLTGSGSAYGFPLISDIGREMERAAVAGDLVKANICIHALALVINNSEVIYV